MITALCFTNIDEFKSVHWPTVFVALPRIGDRVAGLRGDLQPELRVVGVTHKEDRSGDPYIRVELHR